MWERIADTATRHGLTTAQVAAILTTDHSIKARNFGADVLIDSVSFDKAMEKKGQKTHELR